ncbi:MAG: hypothetical protein K5873_01090 [Treponema sp.]|nr:hypothetical protein [Treponema sp.]
MNPKYSEIIDYQWLGSLKHNKMPLASRAKIFMPFAALRGYEEALERVRKESLEEKVGQEEE